jgi:cbb3-type cytochrome oxidase maturation protein
VKLSISFLTIWIVIAVLMTLGLVAMIFWAAKTGQFKDQGRAAGLPLAGPEEPDDDEEKKI